MKTEIECIRLLQGTRGAPSLNEWRELIAQMAGKEVASEFDAAFADPAPAPNTIAGAYVTALRAAAEVTTREQADRALAVVRGLPVHVQLMFWMDAGRRTPDVVHSQSFSAWTNANMEVILAR